MRRDGIPYVPNISLPTAQPPLEEMDLQTVVKLRLRNCAKSNGLVTVCRDCENKCADGKRAVELLYGSQHMGPVMPPSQTILGKMRQEKIESSKPMITKDGRQYMKGWYEEAAKQPDPLKWIMETFEISKTQAKRKIANWNSSHTTKPLLEPSGKKVGESPKPEKKTPVRITFKNPNAEEQPKKEVEKAVDKAITPDDVLKDNQGFASIMRKKIEVLTADRENYKKQADTWMALYKSVDEKITALTMALEAFSE